MIRKKGIKKRNIMANCCRFGLLVFFSFFISNTVFAQTDSTNMSIGFGNQVEQEIPIDNPSPQGNNPQTDLNGKFPQTGEKATPWIFISGFIVLFMVCLIFWDYQDQKKYLYL